MLPAIQYQLTNATDPERKYTYAARVIMQGVASWQVVINGDTKCSPEEACDVMMKACAEVRAAIGKSKESKPAPSLVDIDLEDLDPAEGGIGQPDGEPVIDDPTEGEGETSVVDDPAEGGIGEPTEPEPASTVSHVGGIVVEMKESSGPAANPQARPAGWPRGDTF